MPAPARRASRRALLAGAVAVLAVTAACSSEEQSEAPASGSTSSSVSSSASTSASPPATSPTATPTATRSTVTVTRTAGSAPTSPRRRATRSPAPSQPAPADGVRGSLVVLNPGHNGGNAANPGYISRQVPSGHGGMKDCDTTGTSTNAGYAEHAFNFDVATKVRRILEARGVRVVMTRPNDSGVGPCVDERAAVGNRGGVDANVSIHADGAPSSGHGFHVNQASSRPDGATAAAAQQSIQLGQAVHRALVAWSGLVPSTYIGTNGYYYRDDLGGLNLARRPTTFLELGNMRNAGDASLQSSAAGRARIASAIAAGILAYLRSR